MDRIQREKVLEKLGKIKALAERGVGGEKETAMRMYEELCRKYNISDDEAEAALMKLETRWFSYSTQLEKEFIAFALWVLTNNLAEEKELCRACLANCRDCSTYENIKDIERQYEELTRQFEN